MLWLALSRIFLTILALIQVGRLTNSEKDLEIIILRHCFLKNHLLFFIELGSRKVYLAGITSNPDGFWVAQQARQFAWQFEETITPFPCLIRDNDSKFTLSFDTVFESQKIGVILTPFQAPNASAFAERWVRTIHQECLDHLLIVNEAPIFAKY